MRAYLWTLKGNIVLDIEHEDKGRTYMFPEAEPTLEQINDKYSELKDLLESSNG